MARRPTMFTRGPIIRSVPALVRLLEAGEWVYWNCKPQHPAWMISQQLQTLVVLVQGGHLRRAIRRKDQNHVD